MPRQVPFYIVDVFAPERYGGNQLCVFSDMQGLTDAQMLQLAREINFAETTFITGGSREIGFDVRIYTPEYEVPFAGHPTLGTAFVIATYLLHQPSTDLTLNLNVGPIQTRPADGLFWFKAAPPVFGRTFQDDSLPNLLGLTSADLVPYQPIEWVSTGLPYLIIPVQSLRAVRSIRINPSACRDWLLAHELHKTNSADGLTTAFFPFCAETYSPENQLNARMLCLENDAIVEDAATGSASSCLLAYLLKNQVLRSTSVRLRVEQGYEMNRPSLIELDGSVRDGNEYSLAVGGQVQFVAKGEWTV